MEGLPFQAKPHDALRMGLASLKEDALPKHPVDNIQKEYKKQAAASQMQMMKDLYGIAAPAKLQIETQILQKFQRLPGMHSSNLGLESLTGALDDFSFESFLGLPQDSEFAEPDLHSQMEQKLSLGTKACTRAFV